jgi:cytochrome c oxidase cbb3-type subunit 3
MTPRIEALVLASAIVAAALNACVKAQGGSSTGPLAQVPAQEVLDRIPAGAPPGEATSIASTIANPFESNPQAVEDGRKLFGAMNCVYCHGPQASGLMGPSLNDRSWRYGGTPAEIFNSIHDGRPKGMPAWGARLPPDQIWRLVAYIESLGGAEPPATAQMAKLGADQPSTTGPEPADQVQTDTARQSLAAEHGQGR